MPKIYKRHCNYCGKYYEKAAQYYCSISCGLRARIITKKTRKKISKIRLERKKRLGYINSPETCIKIGKAGIGRTAWNKDKPYLQIRGEKHWNWHGGVNPLFDTIRNCLKYKQWHKAIFERDYYACQKCGDNKGKNLIVHHKKLFTTIFKEYNIKTIEDAINCNELWNVNNGQTLCIKCHEEFHKKNGYKF